MKKILLAFFSCFMLAASFTYSHTSFPHKSKGQPVNGGTKYIKAASALVQRLLPGHTGAFKFEWIPADGERDVFELERVKGKIVIRGNTGVSMASGLNWYLEKYCNCHISLHYHRLSLPEKLPGPGKKIRVTTPFKYRNYFNYCTFGYTTVWWDWPRWERMIDYMALNGVNMPLAITGQEGVWLNVYRQLGLTDRQLQNFFVGPAYLPWGWMGNIDGLGGPLPLSWIKQRVNLQKKIVAREREFGMKPILQGFTGHVPAALKEKFPNAELHRTTDWAGMKGTWLLEPADPLFNRIGQAFIREQTRLFGTDHLYNADCFNEINPPSADPAFIRKVGKGVYGAMKSADPEAVWVLQGWFFYWQKDFWKAPQSKALLDAVPDDRMIGLDLFAETHPVWKTTDAFYGKPWVWNVLLYFSQKVNMTGDLEIMQRNLAEAMESDSAGKLRGIGIMMEGMGYNPVVQEFLLEKTWEPARVDLQKWMAAYSRRRYGSSDPRLQKAWRLLLEGPYSRNMRNGFESLICTTPRLSRFRPTEADRFGAGYDAYKTVDACQLLLECADDLKNLPAYRFDVVHTTREMMNNLAHFMNHRITKAYIEKDAAALEKYSIEFIRLIKDMDTLLATNEHFLLGKWLAHAEKWGTTGEEKKLYHFNARAVVTMWEPAAKSVLRDYASKQWNGLLSGFYLPRWQLFLDRLAQSLAANERLKKRLFHREIKAMELKWIKQYAAYPAKPAGDPVETAKRMFKKYISYYRTPAGE